MIKKIELVCYSTSNAECISIAWLQMIAAKMCLLELRDKSSSRF